jgi:hypothetical protein
MDICGFAPGWQGMDGKGPPLDGITIRTEEWNTN